MNDSREPIRLAVLQEDEDGTIGRLTSLSFGQDGTLETEATLEPELETADEGERPWRVTANKRWLFFGRSDPESPEGSRIDRYPLSSLEMDESCALGPIPISALCPDGDDCLVGGAGRVDLARFAPGACELQPIFRAEDEVQRAKEVDALALADDRLVAVDDRIAPKFAFVLERDRAGNWRHLYTAPLPEYPNEHFRQATAASGKLAIRTTFHHRAGSGQRLLLLDVAPDGLTVTAQAMEIRGTGLLKYGRSRLAGRTHSNWYGLGILGDRVYIGAAERGILICRADMGDEDRAGRMKTGGTCLDLVVRGSRIYALVESGQGKKATTSLAILSPDESGASLVLRATHPLPDHPTRIVT